MYYDDDKLEKRDLCPQVCGSGSAACNTAVIEEMVDVCVPVTVEPSVDVGNVTVSVVDEPAVRPVQCKHFSQQGFCKFVVSQKLCVRFPITFNATASAIDDLSTDCCEDEYPEPYC